MPDRANPASASLMPPISQSVGVAHGQCRWCTEPLPAPKPGQKRRYCSTSCKRAAEYRARQLDRLIGAATKAVNAPDWKTTDEVRAYERQKLERYQAEREALR